MGLRQSRSMARKLRLEFAGACYHVLNRGNYRRHVFGPAGAKESFYRCLDEACTSFGWLVHAFTIMSNHFHLTLETPEPNLSEGMKWLQGTWAQRFNRFQGENGRPFQGRYKAWYVEPGHALAEVAHYVHLNPVRARLVPVSRLAEYRWSSLALFPRRDRPAWLIPTTVLWESGGLGDSAAGWRSYRDYLGFRLETEPALWDEKYLELIRRWAIGSTAFRAELREKLRTAAEQRARFGLVGADREAIRTARGEWWEDELRRIAGGFGINLATLPRKKSAVEKLTLAAAMKEATSVSMAWLAQRLQMGVPDSVGSLLTRFRAAGGAAAARFARKIPDS